MSRTYRVDLRDTVTDTVRSADEARWELALLPILSESEMVELCEEVLRERGFEEQDDGRWGREGAGGERLIIDLELMEVVVQVEAERDLETEIVARGAAESPSDARREAREELELQRRAARVAHRQREEELGQSLRSLLEESAAERERELHEITSQVYAEALKRKARTLGDVMEIREERGENGEYELTIKVHEA